MAKLKGVPNRSINNRIKNKVQKLLPKSFNKLNKMVLMQYTNKIWVRCFESKWKKVKNLLILLLRKHPSAWHGRWLRQVARSLMNNSLKKLIIASEIINTKKLLASISYIRALLILLTHPQGNFYTLSVMQTILVNLKFSRKSDMNTWEIYMQVCIQLLRLSRIRA